MACLTLPLALVACGPGGGSPNASGAPGGSMPTPEVAVVTVQARDLPVEYEYTGQTAGSRETEVRARVPGILLKRLFTEGAAVAAGAPLFQIDPAPFQTQVAQTEAAVAVAEARMNQTRRDHARLAPLAADKAISQKEFDDSQSALESAQATLRQVQAQASEARLNLGYTTVLAPIGGTTGVAAKSDGSLVTAADSLLTTLVQTNPIHVNFSVSEADWLRMGQQIKAGQLALPGKRAANGSFEFAVKLKLADGSVYPQTGKLNFASEKINAQTGNLDLRAEIPNPNGDLRPGQFVRVLLGGAKRPAGLAVPQRAVIDSPFGKMVFIVSPDDKLVPSPVELDGWSQGDWIVTKGVKSGDRVLVDGFIKAHDPGMTVKPVPYVPLASAAAGPAGDASKPPQSANSDQNAAKGSDKSASNATK